MSEIKYPPITEILKRRLQADTQPSLSDAIVPVLTLEHDRPEWKFLQGEMLMAAQLFLTNNPGTVHWHSQLYNPPSSNVIAIIEGITLAHTMLSGGTGPSGYYLNRHDAAISSLHLQTYQRDTRWDAGLASGNRRSPIQLRSEIAGAQIGSRVGVVRYNFGMLTATASTYGSEWPAEFPLVLGPGAGWLIHFQGQGAVVNNAVFGWQWRERPMNPWEAGFQGA